MSEIDLQAIAATMKYVVVPACPVCDQPGYEPILLGRYNCVLCRCPDCGLVFLNPRPNRSGKSEYSPGHATQKYLPRMVKLGFLSADHTPNLLKLYGRYLKLVQMTCQLKPTSPVVDIGCGIGLSMLALRYKEIDSVGIDINDEFMDVARNTFGLDVRKHDVRTEKIHPAAKVATLNAVSSTSNVRWNSSLPSVAIFWLRMRVWLSPSPILLRYSSCAKAHNGR